MRKHLLALAALTLFALSAQAQTSVVGNATGKGTATVTGAAPSGATYTFANYTFCPETGTSAPTVATSSCTGSGGALTVATGDVIIALCRNGGGFTTDALTDSLGNTPNSVTGVAGTGTAQQVSYIVVTTSGSDNFTCTPSSSANFQSIVIVHYTVIGTATNDATATGNTTTSVATATFTSNPFSTSAKGLILFCASLNSASESFTAGTIAGSSATLRGISGATPFATTNADAAIEDVTSSSSQASVTASMNYPGGTQQWAGTVLAFK